jgi:AraC-like DNA-binding protein
VIYDHQLVLFSKGAFRVEIEGREHLCPADSYIIIPPGRWHTTWNIGNQVGCRHWSHFDWNYQGAYDSTPLLTYHPARPISRLYRQAPSLVPSPIFHGRIPQPQKVYDLHERLCQMQMLGNDHDKLASRALLLELLIHLLHAPDERTVSKAPRSWLAYQVRERLKDAVEKGGDVPPIRSMLEEFRLSYAHLCRRFRAEYGIAPLKYVQSLRISRARLLLRDTTMNISEIAAKAGFNDLAYFSQLFRRMTGMKPTTYRAKLKSCR